MSGGGGDIRYGDRDGRGGSGRDGGDRGGGAGNEPDLEGHPHQHQGLLDEKEEDLLT